MTLKILCVHGVGKHPNGGPWEGLWKRSIEAPITSIDPEIEIKIEFAYLDDIFDDYPIDAEDILKALVKLGASGLMAPFRQPRGMGANIRWTAGMVVQWVENDELRQRTRDVITSRIKEFKPHLIIGHSLGSLVCYDAFTSKGGDPLIKGRRFVSCGSQIGNPFVIGNFAGGRLTPLPAAYWYHLYNEEDDVFTAPIRLSASNFSQIDTYFDIEDSRTDHDVTWYMKHARTTGTVWSDMVLAQRHSPLSKRWEIQKPTTKGEKLGMKPKRRALLVGLNEYADSSQDLEGCVNDVFLVSSLLQESGFDAEDIRIVLNDRATCEGLRSRMEWLLNDTRAGDIRFFYFSGHGAQLPTYGVNERIDRVHETLVLHDFDWTKRNAFTDEEFYDLYSQLPYDSRFFAVFDCCHAGGMTRSTSSRVRGISPPDDVRHRTLRWDPQREMWVPRRLPSPNSEFAKRFDMELADTSITHRLGCAMDLRTLPKPEQKKLAAKRHHQGPYLPVLIYACETNQFAFEYQHGAISHGAFTYSLVKTLRGDRRLPQPKLTFESLIDVVRDELGTLGYNQRPSLIAPSSIAKLKVALTT